MQSGWLQGSDEIFITGHAHPAASPSTVSAAVCDTYATLCNVAHLKDFFAEHSYNIEPSPRIAAEEVQQFSTGNEIKTAGAFGLGR
jgi:hypothetical protein